MTIQASDRKRRGIEYLGDPAKATAPTTLATLKRVLAHFPNVPVTAQPVSLEGFFTSPQRYKIVTIRTASRTYRLLLTDFAPLWNAYHAIADERLEALPVTMSGYDNYPLATVLRTPLTMMELRRPVSDQRMKDFGFTRSFHSLPIGLLPEPPKNRLALLRADALDKRIVSIEKWADKPKKSRRKR